MTFDEWIEVMNRVHRENPHAGQWQMVNPDIWFNPSAESIELR